MIYRDTIGFRRLYVATNLRDVHTQKKREMVLKEPRNRLRKTDVLSGIKSNPSK